MEKAKAPKFHSFNEQVVEALNIPVPMVKTITINVDKLVTYKPDGTTVIELEIPITVDEELNKLVDQLETLALGRGLPIQACTTIGDGVFLAFDRHAVACRLSQLLVLESSK